MRSAVLGVVVLVASVLPNAAHNANSAKSGAKTTQTIRGCLSKTGNTYVILGYTPMRQYRIIVATSQRLKARRIKLSKLQVWWGKKSQEQAQTANTAQVLLQVWATTRLSRNR